MKLMEQVKDGVIISCQALPNEPLHGSEIMARMALAAAMGGAVAIRSNSREDVAAIKAAVQLPVIGLVKRDYEGFEVFITPTHKEIDELIEAGADMIALDATRRPRPEGCKLEDLVHYMKSKGVPIMADVSTLEEAQYAAELGVDCVSTTLSGYTSYSPQLEGPDFNIVEQAAKLLKIPVIAEGRIKQPAHVEAMLKLGAHSVVVGGAITRPQLIALDFTAAAAKHRRAVRNGDQITS